MYKKYINLFIAAALTLTITSCKDMLKEKPQAQLVPSFFQTAQGLQAGIISAYSGLRWIHGPDGPLVTSVIGTDEFGSTDALNGQQTSYDTYDANLSANNAPNYWNICLQFINTCNGIIDFGTTATGLTDVARTQLLAEAHFLRGYYYYILTMNFGAAPLDLGSGKLKFNQTPTTLSIRDSRADVFAAIIDDFTFASANLPDKPTAATPGHATKGSALHFLAKTYLSRASMDGAQSSDYQSAYNTAMTLINGAATYGTSLTQDFATINVEGNENAAEVLFNVQRTWTATGPNLSFDEANDGTSAQAVANKGNRSNFFFTAGYENVKNKANVALVPRSIAYQRPWRMFIPTQWLVMTAFNDKVNDARWDGSFRTVWMAGNRVNIKGRIINVGDTAIKVSLNMTETAVAADSVGAQGTIFKPYALYYWGMLYNANGSYKVGGVQYMYPSLKKYDDTKRSNMNYDSNRPFILARLAETYLIAAEASMYLGNTTEAARLINIVRERAAYRPGLSGSDLATRKANMDITPAQVTIDFILDERAREFCGEGWRWIDLVRTNKLIDRVKLYNFKGKNNIDAHHMLRPIPQGQLDALSDASQKANYQNPGY